MPLPWAGKLGGHIIGKCLWCGRSDASFQLSSAPSSCLHAHCRTTRYVGKKPIPELLAEHNKKTETLAREWCKNNGFDYDAEIKKIDEALKDHLE